MKLSTLTILMMCIVLSIMVFDNTAEVIPGNGTISYYGTNPGEITEDSTKTELIWGFIWNPANWAGEHGLIWYISVTIVGLFGIVAVGALATRSFAPGEYVWAIFYGATIIVASIPTILLYDFIQVRGSAVLCQPGTGFCFLPTVIAGLIAGSLGVMWVFKVISTWRTGQE